MKYTTTIDSKIGCDVIVCGGGPAGIGAALSAAMRGLKVLLVESQGQLGGMGTSGLVSHWLGGRSYDCKNWVVGGVFRELSLEAYRRGIALLPDVEAEGMLSPHGWCKAGPITAGVPFDPFAMASLLDEVMNRHGVDVLFFTSLVDVVLDDDRIARAIIHNKSGYAEVGAAVVIDATGDADAASLAGCETVLGREEDRLMTPVTLQVHMDRIDGGKLAAYQNRKVKGGGLYRFLDEIQELMKQGEWPFEYDRLISVQMTNPDTFMVNTSRLVGYDGTSAVSVSAAMVQGRKESLQLLEILRKHFPGFENARIKAIAPLLGVRETRRIIGDFVLKIKDIVEERPFPDIIGYAAYGFDLPDPKRPSFNPDMGKEQGIKKHLMPIPYRVLIPRPVANLLCPGRAVSVERYLLGPFRVQAPCMAMGEAAGVAASLAIKSDGNVSHVDPALLRKELVAQKAIVDEAEIGNNPVEK